MPLSRTFSKSKYSGWNPISTRVAGKQKQQKKIKMIVQINGVPRNLNQRFLMAILVNKFKVEFSSNQVIVSGTFSKSKYSGWNLISTRKVAGKQKIKLIVQINCVQRNLNQIFLIALSANKFKVELSSNQLIACGRGNILVEIPFLSGWPKKHKKDENNCPDYYPCT